MDDQAGGGCRGNRAPDFRRVDLPVRHKCPATFDGRALDASRDGECWANNIQAHPDDSRNRAPCDEVKCSCRSSGDEFSKQYRPWPFIPCRSPFAISGSGLRSPRVISPSGLCPLRHPLAPRFVFGLTHAEHEHLRLPRISFQQDKRNHARGVPLVHVVASPRAGVHDRSQAHVVAVDERPQPFALLS